MHHPRLLPAITLALLGAPVTALACETGVPRLDQLQEGIDYGFFYSESVERWQEFVPSEPILSRLDLFLMTNIAIYDRMTAEVSILDDEGWTMWTGSFEFDGFWFGWVEFDLPELAVAPGLVHTITVSGYGGEWRGSTTSDYPGHSDPDSSWEGYDYAFRTYVPGNTTVVGFGPESIPPFNGTIVLADQLADCGLRFSTTDPRGVIWFGEHSQASFPYVITAGGLAGVSGPGGIAPIRIEFKRTVSRVSIRGFDGGGDIDTMVVRAFDAGRHEVDAVKITDGFGYPGHVATVEGRITSVTVQANSDFAGLFFDDLVFERATPDGAGLRPVRPITISTSR